MGKAVTVSTKKVGSKELRVVKQDGHFYGLIDRKNVLKGSDPDKLMSSLYEEMNKQDPKFFGFDGARNRFLYWYHGGFGSSNFIADERKFKCDAKWELDTHAPLEDALTGSGFGHAALSVFQRTFMLSKFELVRIREVLTGPKADAFIRGAARFATGDLKEGLFQMVQVLPHDIARWTAVSYLPFLWRPESHMFLKPETTKDFALQVGHAFAQEYEAKLKVSVYESLLDLVAKTELEIADLHPKDRIDVQPRNGSWRVTY